MSGALLFPQSKYMPTPTGRLAAVWLSSPVEITTAHSSPRHAHSTPHVHRKSLLVTIDDAHNSTSRAHQSTTQPCRHYRCPVQPLIFDFNNPTQSGPGHPKFVYLQRPWWSSCIPSTRASRYVVGLSGRAGELSLHGSVRLRQRPASREGRRQKRGREKGKISGG